MSDDVRTDIAKTPFLTWVARETSATSALVLPNNVDSLVERRIALLDAGTFAEDECFVVERDERDQHDLAHDYRILHALGISVASAIQWDGARFRVLRSLLPDGRYGDDTSMARVLRDRIPVASLASRVRAGAEARTGFHRTHHLDNYALVTGHLVGRGPDASGQPRGIGAQETELDSLLDGLSLIREPFAIHFVAEPLPAAFLAGAQDFLLAAASLCSSGAEVTLQVSASQSNQEGRSEADPRYRVHRAAAGALRGFAQAGAMLIGAAALGGGVPLAAGAALLSGAAHVDLGDLFGWNAQIQVSRTESATAGTSQRQIDERLVFFSTKLKELATLFDDGGTHGLWTWYAAVAAHSASVAHAVAGALSGRLAIAGNTLEPLRVRGVSPAQAEAAAVCLDRALVPRMQEPIGLLGHAYGSLAQSRVLPLLFARPGRSHAGVRVIRHLPVSFSRDAAADGITLGHRPDERTAIVQVSRADLAGHMLVCGRTGSGKTRLVRGLLRQLDRGDSRVPFVFIDMAQSIRTEDFAFAKDPVWYESGRDDLSPSLPSLGLLDFGTPAEYDHYVWQVADVLANWLPSEGPLPLLLTEIMHAALRPHLTDEGHFWRAGEPTVPKLSELEKSIDVVLGSDDGQRYEGELRSNLRGALVTRLRRLQNVHLAGLLEGTSSDFLQTLQRKHDVIVSLGRSGSSSERNFIALLLLMKVRQWLRETREDSRAGDARLVIVLDEAHVLLRKASERDRGTQNNIHAFAVRWFDEFIAEVRQLGAAVVIVDQSPSLLADSVLFGTSTKIVMPLSSGEDAQVTASSLGLPPQAARSLTTLPNLFAYLRTPSAQDLSMFRIADEDGR